MSVLFGTQAVPCSKKLNLLAHAQLYAARGRYYDLYTRQHGVEENLFLAPGEGDAVTVNGNGTEGKSGDVKAADALRVLRGEMR